MNYYDLSYAMGQRNLEEVDALLTRGIKINEQSPEYLNCLSIEFIKVFLKHGIDLNGCDAETKTTLLHRLAWADRPEVFDFAYKNGCTRWTKDSSNRTPYVLAQQGFKEQMVHHFRMHYQELITNNIESISTGNYAFESVYCLKQSTSNPHWFFALTENGKLIRYLVNNAELLVDQVFDLNVPTIRNFTFDKDNNIIIPNGSNKLLIIDQSTIQLIKTIDLGEELIVDQIEYLPSKKVFIGSSNQWKLTVLSKDFKIISTVSSKNGTIAPVINRQESLVSFLSYDQDTFYDLYKFRNNLKFKFITTFYKKHDTPSRGFYFNDNEFAVSFPHECECYRFVNGQVKKRWKIDISHLISEHHLSSLIFINNNWIILGKGKTLFYINKEQKQIVREEKLDLQAEIRDLFSDNGKKNLIVSTDAELKLLPLTGMDWEQNEPGGFFKKLWTRLKRGDTK